MILETIVHISNIFNWSFYTINKLKVIIQMLLCLFKCRQICREAFVITLSTLSELMAKNKNHESTLSSSP